jgi:hypothetical protein
VVNLILSYKWDLETRQPRLEAPEGLLSDAEYQELSQEVRKNYARWAQHDEAQVTLKTRLKKVPRPRFRLRVERGPEERCPNLVLEHLPAAAPPGAYPTGNGTGPQWLGALLRGVETWLGSTPPPGVAAVERTAYRFAVQELVSLRRERGGVLAALLVGAYMALAEDACKPHDPERAALYRLAARVVQEFLHEQFAGEVPHPESDEAAPRRGKRQRTARFLARALGLAAEGEEPEES